MQFVFCWSTCKEFAECAMVLDLSTELARYLMCSTEVPRQPGFSSVLAIGAMLNESSSCVHAEFSSILAAGCSVCLNNSVVIVISLRAVYYTVPR